MVNGVVVVGGGLVGCAVALELARRRVPVTVLERAVPGAEASSSAAGILAPRVEAHGHPEQRALGLRALAAWTPWARSLDADVGLSTCGVLVVREARPDPDAAWIDGERLAEVAPGLSATGGWWLPDEGVVDTRPLVGAVHRAAVRAGAQFRTGLTVARVAPDGVTAGGERFAGVPVVCAGAWAGTVPGCRGVPVEPVRGQLVALGTTSPARSVVFGPGGYVVPRHDETVIGATMEQVGFERGTTAIGLHAVLGSALALFPRLGEAPVLRHWSNFRPCSPDGRPLVGVVDGTWVATGHSRNGILLAPLTAALLADALLDGAPLPPAWSPSRFADPGASA